MCIRDSLKTCVYFEDLEKNLENAHKYGITTVHIEDKINKKKQLNHSLILDLRVY